MFYRQTYSVSLNGEMIGYTKNKVALQKKINDYITSGDGDDVAFVELEKLPEYKSCLLKKDVETNDDEVFNKVISSGTSYYRYYAITDNEEEKEYVKTFSEADEVVNTLKEKNSQNANSLGIVEKYSAKKNVNSENKSDENNAKSEDTDNEAGATDEKEASSVEDYDEVVKKIASVDDCVTNLYKKVEVKRKTTSVYQNVGRQVYKTSGVATSLGISLARPMTTGVISSRFGIRSRDNHKGLDIAAPKGTAIMAAAAGTVIFSGSGSPYSGYGNVVVVQSSPSVIIIYGHCSALCVHKGESVVQGQLIAKVGSTGYSTGNHLHFEIRYNGVAVDPQNYIYN